MTLKTPYYLYFFKAESTNKFEDTFEALVIRNLFYLMQVTNFRIESERALMFLNRTHFH